MAKAKTKEAPEETPYETPVDPVETTKRQLLGLSYDCPAPFKEGHVCTAGEAATLNQTLAEAVGNNNRSLVQAALDEMNGDIKKGEPGYNVIFPDDVANKLRGQIEEYAANYKFAVGGGNRRGPTDPVGKAATERATSIIETLLQKNGQPSIAAIKKTKNDAAIEKLMGKIENLAASDEIMEWAREKVRAEQEEMAKLASAIALEDL